MTEQEAMSLATPRPFFIKDRKYLIHCTSPTWETWQGRFRELTADAKRSGRWHPLNAAHQEFLITYGEVAQGFNLPPGKELPSGMCFGRYGRLDEIPTEDPERACWDDNLPPPDPNLWK